MEAQIKNKTAQSLVGEENTLKISTCIDKDQKLNKLTQTGEIKTLEENEVRLDASEGRHSEEETKIVDSKDSYLRFSLSKKQRI